MNALGAISFSVLGVLSLINFLWYPSFLGLILTCIIFLVLLLSWE